MSAKIIKRGSSDYGYVSAECNSPECQDINGRPWIHSYSRRTVEGYTLAERDMKAHNKARHSAGTARRCRP